MDDDKVYAIKQLHSPTNVTEFRWLMRMLNYLSRCIPNHSDLTFPLRLQKLYPARTNKSYLWRLVIIQNFQPTTLHLLWNYRDQLIKWRRCCIQRYKSVIQRHKNWYHESCLWETSRDPNMLQQSQRIVVMA